MTRQEKQILADETVRTDALTAFRFGQIVATDDFIEVLKDITKKDDIQFALTLAVIKCEMVKAELVDKVLASYTDEDENEE